ncbi:MAG: hypothetical protein R6X02_16045 [Enhygromyxa sp.]
MNRLGFTILLVFAAACERSESSTTPEPTPAVSPAESPAEPEPRIEPEPEPEPEPEQSEETGLSEAVFSREGFEARNLNCSFNTPTSGGSGYIAAGLVDADAELDACAPKGAAVTVSWDYVSGGAANISVEATSPKLANCVAAAMTKVRAGVDANCSAVLLIGDSAGAAAAFEAR